MRQKAITNQRLARLTMSTLLAAALATLPLTAQSAEAPQAVSPGAAGAAVRTAGFCPTFSWSGVTEAAGYELVLYRVDKTGALEQILQTEVPGDGRSWTPSAEACPAAGADYAWAVRGLTSNGAGSWSEPLLFQTPGTPSDEEVRLALETLRRYREGRAEDVGEGLAPSRVADADASGRDARRYPTGEPAGPPTTNDQQPTTTLVADLEALSLSTLSASPSPQTVTAPSSFSLNLSGDVELGGFVFKDGIPFIHNDGGNAGYNTAVGINALVSATPGSPSAFSGLRNTALGSQALRQNTEGSQNTAIGFYALGANTEGFFNVATGSAALSVNTTGNLNTASGFRALNSNTAGTSNSAFGAYTLRFNIEGQNNTASGFNALRSNTGGSYNTADGYGALALNTTGSRNTAAGVDALSSNDIGNYNTAIGDRALADSTGFNNTAVGVSAGANWTDGSNNIAIGNGSSGVAGESNTIRIGGSKLQQRAFITGVHGTTTDIADAITVMIDSDGQLGTISSSARFKEDIHNLGRLSARLADLRPVAFRYKRPFAGGAKPIQFGLIAEEVAEAFPELVVYDEEGRPETVKYHLLSTLLLNEVQKQHLELQRLARLDSQVALLERTVAEQRRRLDRLAKKKRIRP